MAKENIILETQTNLKRAKNFYALKGLLFSHDMTRKNRSLVLYFVGNKRKGRFDDFLTSALDE